MNSASRFFLFLLAVSALFAQPANGASKLDLAAPSLKVNSALPQNDMPGSPLATSLAESRAAANRRGIPWTGVDGVVLDETGDVGGFDIPTIYAKLACEADAIMLGQIGASVAHISASAAAIYTDYDFVIHRLLKDNRERSVRSVTDVVVTRPGGSLSIGGSPVSYSHESYPPLNANTTYLLFARYVAASDSYQAVDPFATLAADGSGWKLTRVSMASYTSSLFGRGVWEANIAVWLSSCATT